jgi:hypothetical protein
VRRGELEKANTHIRLVMLLFCSSNFAMAVAPKGPILFQTRLKVAAVKIKRDKWQREL